MKNSNDVVIVAAARTPIGKFGEAFRTLRAHELAATVITEVLRRSGIEAGLLDDVILGDCVQCPDEANTARTAALKAGIPVEVPAVTIQRQCSSAMAALAFGDQAIKAGDAQSILAGGVESMSSAPYVLKTARWGQRLTHGEMTDAMWEMLHSGSNLLEKKGYIMGQTAENLAEKYDISRLDQDIVALRSHNNAEAAIKDGKFKEEIVPVSIPQKKCAPKVVDTDEHVRYALTMADLERLAPAFKKEGTVTAGNSSGLNDGAAAVLVTNRQRAQELGLTPLAKIVAQAAAGVDPKFMGYGPVPATEKCLKRAGLALSDIQLIEVNEAFASQYIACERGLGLNRDITNVNGSGIGLGHPVGATGVRIIISLLYEMKRRNLALGLATLCVGGGMGMTTIIENE
ncbi:MAG TPA: acetyl-CoA C-acetyltransferase [Thermodesulfobacteriota bacterium]|nr:acetyl-CoA C-acetyltransferase [Thermodesulfobacteriota bacterium]